LLPILATPIEGKILNVQDIFKLLH
jgi:hypothetical protein